MRTDSELLGVLAAAEARVRGGAGEGADDVGVVEDVVVPGMKGFVAGRVGEMNMLAEALTPALAALVGWAASDKPLAELARGALAVGGVDTRGLKPQDAGSDAARRAQRAGELTPAGDDLSLRMERGQKSSRGFVNADPAALRAQGLEPVKPDEGYFAGLGEAYEAGVEGTHKVMGPGARVQSFVDSLKLSHAEQDRLAELMKQAEMSWEDFALTEQQRKFQGTAHGFGEIVSPAGAPLAIGKMGGFAALRGAKKGIGAGFRAGARKLGMRVSPSSALPAAKRAAQKTDLEIPLTAGRIFGKVLRAGGMALPAASIAGGMTTGAEDGVVKFGDVRARSSLGGAIGGVAPGALAMIGPRVGAPVRRLFQNQAKAAVEDVKKIQQAGRSLGADDLDDVPGLSLANPQSARQTGATIARGGSGKAVDAIEGATERIEGGLEKVVTAARTTARKTAEGVEEFEGAARVSGRAASDAAEQQRTAFFAAQAAARQSWRERHAKTLETPIAVAAEEVKELQEALLENAPLFGFTKEKLRAALGRKFFPPKAKRKSGGKGRKKQAAAEDPEMTGPMTGGDVLQLQSEIRKIIRGAGGAGAVTAEAVQARRVIESTLKNWEQGSVTGDLAKASADYRRTVRNPFVGSVADKKLVRGGGEGAEAVERFFPKGGMNYAALESLARANGVESAMRFAREALGARNFALATAKQASVLRGRKGDEFATALLTDAKRAFAREFVEATDDVGGMTPEGAAALFNGWSSGNVKDFANLLRESGDPASLDMFAKARFLSMAAEGTRDGQEALGAISALNRLTREAPSEGRALFGDNFESIRCLAQIGEVAKQVREGIRHVAHFSGDAASASGRAERMAGILSYWAFLGYGSMARRHFSPLWAVLQGSGRGARFVMNDRAIDNMAQFAAENVVSGKGADEMKRLTLAWNEGDVDGFQRALLRGLQVWTSGRANDIFGPDFGEQVRERAERWEQEAMNGIAEFVQ